MCRVISYNTSTKLCRPFLRNLAVIGENQGECWKIFVIASGVFRKRLTMHNITDEIQSITSVVQNAVIMPMLSYIRVHLVQSC